MHYFDDNDANNIVYSTNWVQTGTAIYKPGMVLVLELLSGELPIFGIIKEILVRNTQEYIFVFQKFVTKEFNEHYHAFEIFESTEKNKWFL